MADTPFVPSALLVTGAYLAWFGVHYWRTDTSWPSDPVKAVLTGKPIPTGQRPKMATPTATGSASGASFVTGSSGPIATAALQYQGAAYAWGGNADRIGNWDCSSFVSYVLSHDLGLALPGGGKWGDPGYPPNSHGPGSTQYMLYGEGVNLSDVMPGDLIVSTEHIGIAISSGQMISAEDPSRGTRVGTFPDGFPAGPPVYRRVPISTPLLVA